MPPEGAAAPVAILGVGIMGAAFARHLLAAGIDLRLYNRTSARAAQLRALGALVVESPAEAVSGCHTVLCSLFDDNASQEVLTGACGALAALDPNAVLVETSTLSLRWVETLSERCSDRGVDLVDAPVCGSKRQAEARTVTFLVSGPESAVVKASPVLEVLSERIIHVRGGHGAATRLKLVNNLLNAAQMASLADAIQLAVGLNVDLDLLNALLENAGAGSPLVRAKLRKAIDGDVSTESALATTIKDLRYISQAAALAGLDDDLLNAVRRRYDRAVCASSTHIDVAAALISSDAGRHEGSLLRIDVNAPVAESATPVVAATQTAGTLNVWGRVTRRRRMANVTFVDLVAEGAKLQVSYPADTPWKCRVGALWRFTGTLGRSQTGERTLFASSAQMLSDPPSLPTAERRAWTVAAADRSDAAAQHARLCVAWTRGLERRGFTAVAPPIVVPVFDGGLSVSTSARFKGRHLGYLRSNFEAPLQRHLADGLPRVFHLGTVHRNGREYLLLEACIAFVTMSAGVNLVTGVLAEVCNELKDRGAPAAAASVDAIAGRRWSEVDVIAAAASDHDLDPTALASDARVLAAPGLPVRPEALLRRWMKIVAENHGCPVAFYNTPQWFSPLYQRADGEDSGLLEAIGIVPGLGVLFDAGIQERNPDAVAARISKQRGDAPGAASPDSPLVDALRLGVPPNFGFGSAIGRLLQLWR